MRFLVLIGIAACLAACGGSSGSSAAETSLTVTVWPGGQPGPSKTATVECPGNDACTKLSALPLKAFDPVPGNVMCNDIYGGPDKAHVEGTLRGQPVDASFKRTDGCETDRWNHVSFLLAAASS